MQICANVIRLACFTFVFISILSYKLLISDEANGTAVKPLTAQEHNSQVEICWYNIARTDDSILLVVYEESSS